MQVKRLSENAQAKVANNSAEVNGVDLKEVFREGGSPVSLGVQTEGDLLPGTMYMIRTNVSIGNVKCPSQLFIRPTLAAFLTGVEVKRWEVTSTASEVIVFVMVLNRTSFKRMEAMFEIFATVESANTEGFEISNKPAAISTAKVEQVSAGFSLSPARELPVVNFIGPLTPPPVGPNPSNNVADDSGKPSPAQVSQVNNWLESGTDSPARMGIVSPDRPILMSTNTVAEALANGPVNAVL